MITTVFNPATKNIRKGFYFIWTIENGENDSFKIRLEVLFKKELIEVAGNGFGIMAKCPTTPSS